MNFIILFLLVFSLEETHANKLQITNLKFENKEQTAKLIIQFKGFLEGSPELIIKEDILQVTMPSSTIWPQISRKISLLEPQDTEIKGYQYDQKTVRVRAILPFKLKGMEKQVSLTLQDNSVELYFPNRRYKSREYDENYLDYLLEQKSNNQQSQDEVKIIQSSVAQENEAIIEEKSFNVMAYIGKYIIFLSIILLSIYGLFLIFKKRVLKKGRLGFLNDSNLISILNTVYLDPKKSLLLVKVHDKILLLGNSENGLSNLSELDNISDLLKQGEREVAGNNFDTTLDSADKDQRKAVEKESLSDQIKRRVKNLRPLQ